MIAVPKSGWEGPVEVMSRMISHGRLVGYEFLYSSHDAEWSIVVSGHTLEEAQTFVSPIEAHLDAYLRRMYPDVVRSLMGGPSATLDRLDATFRSRPESVSASGAEHQATRYTAEEIGVSLVVATVSFGGGAPWQVGIGGNGPDPATMFPLLADLNDEESLSANRA